MVVRSGPTRTWMCKACASQVTGDFGKAIALVARTWFAGEELETTSSVFAIDDIHRACPSCGLQAFELIDGGFMGCETCYSTFDQELHHMIELFGNA